MQRAESSSRQYKAAILSPGVFGLSIPSLGPARRTFVQPTFDQLDLRGQ